MKNSLYQRVLGGLLVLLAASCVDPYRPPEIAAPASYLVVNGFFDSTPGATTSIRLSRSQNLSDKNAPTAESGATVTIESAGNTIYRLQESPGGVYSLAGIPPISGETYRLHIRTAAGGDYVSDYVPVVKTPPIDSLHWTVENDGVQFNVSTHDPTNRTRYYRWEFDETWAYTSAYYSGYIYNDKTKDVELRQDNIFTCWSTTGSKNILTTSTARLSQAVVNRFPLNFVDGRSMKFQRRYSLLVRQYALTQAGYNYYDQLAKLTQNVGSLFDPQPSQLTGNMRSTSNPADLVLGFFWAGDVTTKRIFIGRAQLPNWRTTTGYELCDVDTLTLSQIRQSQPGIMAESGLPGPLYLTTTFECIDCRLQGGINKKPDFWDE
ncbi:hypothetical protein FAES_2590 [Fibrella aestuarina BUZ 2]|uniref:DUF4249 domain-containing protein n=1 Tax=Fibrella aestuarina BUZ 2 TaxID=1166018 RepID=I0K8Z6_9BACT|nr:DUF4249 domain-containing protein [Fibrella aestuarina]CCH00599.1 hypothetical protein FAES_2590 [Fibrella aestuarina BUZ 2]